MSHLHRQLAANAAIAADKDTTHPCTPTVPDSSIEKPVRAPRAKAKRKARRRG